VAPFRPSPRNCDVNARTGRDAVLFSLPLGALALACVLLGWFAVDRVFGPVDPGLGDPISGDSVDLSKELSALRNKGRELRGQLSALRPRGNYVVVDRENNRIYLRRGDSVLVDAAASTGSGAVLKETSGQQRSWTFDTPQGRFPILAERGNPVWTKPDWAFLEAGEPIPERISERKDYGSLGEFALDLGDGYMIHGTLYERLLGRSVTHGCVRVGRDALRAIVGGTRVGTPVFIF
jgi:L,D-transpeptidase ErfK/SrfK